MCHFTDVSFEDSDSEGLSDQEIQDLVDTYMFVACLQDFDDGKNLSDQRYKTR